MATANPNSGSKGYGPSRWQRLYFDGDERKFEQWLVKFLGYMRLQGLKDVIDPPATTGTGGVTTASTTASTSTTPPTTGGGDTTTGTNDTPTTVVATDDEKNAQAFAELIQFLDDRSLSLVMRDALDKGKEALCILKKHYQGSGKPRILSLYTELTSLSKGSDEDITDYILRAEKHTSALRTAKQTVDDSLLIAMVLKGLPAQYKPFEVVVTQGKEDMTFHDFKEALKSFEDTEKARGKRRGDPDNIFQFKDGGKPLTCYKCQQLGHKANVCPNGKVPSNKNSKKRWCSHCNNNSHYTKFCRKGKKSDSGNSNKNGDQRDNADGGSGSSHHFVMMMNDTNNNDKHCDEEKFV